MERLVTITRGEAGTAIRAPYNPELVRRLKELGSRWDKKGGAWTAPALVESEALDALRETFGTDGTEDDPDLVAIDLTALDEIVGKQEAVYVAGIQVARAFDRDSGAKKGDHVALISGDIDSGGSAKYWTTTVAEGTKFRLTLPRAALGLIDRDLWSVAIRDDDEGAAGEEDVARLLGRRAELMEELREIEERLRGLGIDPEAAE